MNRYWTNNKNSCIYEVTNNNAIDTTNDRDGTPVVCYKNTAGMHFVREKEEFLQKFSPYDIQIGDYVYGCDPNHRLKDGSGGKVFCINEEGVFFTNDKIPEKLSEFIKKYNKVIRHKDWNSFHFWQRSSIERVKL